MGEIIDFNALKRYSIELIERPDGSFSVCISNNIEHDDLQGLAAALLRTAMELHNEADHIQMQG